MEFVVVLAALVVAEVVFAWWIRRSGTEKRTWLRGRIALRAVELGVALAARLLPVWGMQWRFSALVAVTAILLLWAVLAYVLRRNKVAGARKTGAVVAGVVTSVLVFGVALVPALVFTGYKGLPTTGSYQVKEASAILVDVSRKESHEADGSAREVPVHFVYPDAEGADAEGSYPLVVFNHGSFGYWESNYSTYAELASNGYVVASIENPYYALFTHDTSGQLITVDPQFMQDAVNLQNGEAASKPEDELEQEWMSTRDADMSFAIGCIEAASASDTLDDAWYVETDADRAAVLQALAMVDASKIGTMGHSIGGAAAMDMARQRGDIDAVIDLDGTMLGEVQTQDGAQTFNSGPFPVPLLALNNEEHGKQYEEGNPDGTEYVNQYVVEHAKDARSLTFAGTEHMDFTDLPLLSPTLAGMLGKGSVDSEEFVPHMNDVILRFYDYYLKGVGNLDQLE